MHKPITLSLSLALVACASTDDKSSPTAESGGVTAAADGPAEPYIIRRAQHATRLSHEAPITEKWPSFDEPPAGAEQVRFSSGALSLWGWYARPEDASDADPVPVVVYLHGGFFAKPGDVELMRPFLDAGFAVFVPTLRGRNGNPGHHELLYGEVDDAAAAVRWVAERPETDDTHVYAIGHSMGGGTVALLALDADVPLAMTASVGGIYSVDTFKRWASGKDSKLVRFDVRDRDELELRVMAEHADELAHAHIAYLGDQEKIFQKNAERAQAKAAEANAPLEVEIVPGDHMGALAPALERFRKRIVTEAFGE
jgi:dipeptidyl aminopeptidase/acylaminoacyl peptidase